MSILHAALAVTATIDKSPTFDEPTHLAAGYSYWLHNDFRMDSENGNWPARWAALPLMISRPNFFAAQDASWKDISIGRMSQQFFYRSGNDPERMLLHGRVMMSILSASLCLVIFFIGQKLFGPIGGLISETLAVFDPNLLGHGALVVSDVPAALFFTAAVWSTWRLFHCVSVRTLALTALSVSGLFLSKMSAPLFLIMAGILALVTMFSRESIEINVAGYRQTISTRLNKFATTGILMTLIGGATILAIWASFGFRFSALSESGRPRAVLDWRWDYLLSEHTTAENAIAFARAHYLLPEAYLYGLLYIEQTSSGRSAFLDHRWSESGFRSFFPCAFVYKTPLSILFLLAMALLAAALRWRHQWRGSPRALSQIVLRDFAKLTPILTLILVYGAFAILAKLNIGHRYIFPIYPAVFIACGGCVYLFRKERLRFAAPLIAVFVSWHVLESFRVRPNYLAYFNQLAGGPSNGYKHLVDSSLDWGQDLPTLKAWLDQNRDPATSERTYLGYFGTGDPDWYKIHATRLPENPSSLLQPLEPGLYCISATVLQHVYEVEQGKWTQSYEDAYQQALSWAQANGMIEFGDIEPSNRPDLQLTRIEIFQRIRFARLCAYLRHREPLANIGYSILVFRLGADDLHQALFGPAPELTPAG